MVYSSTSFLKIREEYPNLDKEVRSLLLAHAQEGATIAEIKDDYYKLTGVNFPDFENITDYFLSIPNVVAYCTEHGTRVFNILPLDKTKHLYNMVMDQRPQNKDLGNYQRHVMRSKNLRNATNTISGYPLNTQNNNIAHHYFPTPLAHCNQKRKNYVLSAMESDQEFCLYSDMLDKNGNCTKTSVQLEANKKNINGESNLNRPAFFNRNITTKYNCDDKCLSCDQQTHKCSSMNSNITPNSGETKLMETSDNGISNMNCDAENVNPAQRQQQEDVGDNYGTKQQQQEITHCLQISEQSQIYHNNMKHLRQKTQQQHLKPSHNRSCIEYTQSNQQMGGQLKHLQRTKNRIISIENRDQLTAQQGIVEGMTNYEAHLLDFLLLGDDFFLYMARMELGCKFHKNQRVLRSGLCVSGQTISAAIRRINQLSYNNRCIIVNIGSVDIMKGQRLIQIEHNFRELITLMICKGLTPILTTLAPLANYVHNHEVRYILFRFNEFIKREGCRCQLMTIDIWRCMVNDKQQTLFDCYQPEPRIVTGTLEPYVFWNKIGRQRVLNYIESHLEY